jgi:tetratricopeptide (TPR) repeat protein
MKSSVIIFVIVCGVVAGTIVCLNRQKASPVPALVAASAPAPATPEKINAPPTASANTDEPAKVSAATPAAGETNPDDSAGSIRRAVDALLSAKSGEQKHELFQQLIRAGRLDQAIAELKQRAADNPNDAEIPTTLGEAQINRLRALRDSGGDHNEIGILAMQADQSFSAALKIDPQNWEAQFVKAASMAHWPADPTRDADVVQRLSSLIDQQETMSSQPGFVQTYIVLGEQYQKIGQPDKAMATWQLGLTKFPNDPALLKKIASP